MAENTETAPAASSSAPSAKNPLVTILLVLNMAAMGTIAFFQYRFMQMEKDRPDLTALLKEKDAKPVEGEAEGEQKTVEVVKKENLLPLEMFTVNLSQGDGPRRYARMEAVLKMSDDAKAAEFEARKPQIRDTIISILNTKRPEDLLKKEGKQFLKEEIKAAINAFLVDGKVDDVYYIGFQIN
ncbi:MAG: flagellar basal body-associated FliL family protein [Bacteriovoracaceae bacterium]|nr:flagellar basal body-associated FliL family protein [Bacteriovoracaceae bacterium]